MEHQEIHMKDINMKYIKLIETTNPEVDDHEVFLNLDNPSQVRIVRSLLSDSRFDPCCNNCYLLDEATRGVCCFDVIKLILEDGRIDPKTDNYNAIINAVSVGDTEVIKLLFDDPRIGKCIPHHAIVEEITRYDIFYDEDLINFLIVDGRTDLLVDNNTFIKTCLMLGDGYITTLLDNINLNYMSWNHVTVKYAFKYSICTARKMMMDCKGNKYLDVCLLLLSCNGLFHNDEYMGYFPSELIKIIVGNILKLTIEEILFDTTLEI
jgi:hypothetical protein